MTASEIQVILHRWARFHGKAVVPEVTILDSEYIERQTRCNEEDYIDRYKGGFIGPRQPRFTEDEDRIAERRIDALVWTGNQERVAVEIKVSRSDFKRETDGKRRPWLQVVHKFVYLCPEGLIEPWEVPKECGLWWVIPNPHNVAHQTIKSVKSAKINHAPNDLPQRILTTLAYRLSNSEKIA